MSAGRDGPILSVRGLRTEFPTTRGRVVAVDGIDLDVMPAECLGVVGESGSGKSVTFLSMLGMVRLPGRVSGEVRFDGRDLLGMGARELRELRGRELAITFQDAQMALNPSLSIGSQILETLAAHGPAGSRRLFGRDPGQVGRAIEMLTRVGIPAAAERLRDYPHQFSGGMRQRAMIAIALVCNPRLLIADEPTSALDVTVQAQVLDLIAKMRRELGMSVVLIAHDLGVVAEHCDRIAVMYAGQIVELGPAEAVIEAPRHPYTQGLIASAPWLSDLTRELRPMPGSVPNLIDMPEGCHFAPRCPFRSDACLRPVAMRTAADGRQVRCIRPEAVA
ncbi:MAG: ABC transporter ATP-binding protein [Rhodobacteraceae bacterium]|jgi:oligopeptide/dipeptide ABC transporter ATP-binding protein|nr:ABC transporter ATP-binding protein [Paracoccaceae bacterium]